MNYFASTCAGNLTKAAKRNRSYLAVLFCLFGFSLVALSQEATIVGTVTDPSGSVLPNVTVTATSVETGQIRTVSTGGSGEYVLPSLHIGHYDLKVEGSGFKAAEQKSVVLNVGDRARIDFQMQIGATKETVTVEATAVRVQSDSGEISNIITGQQITQLATNGRSLYSLFAATPGAASIQGDFGAPTPVSGDSNVSINGQRAGHNLQLIDGGENLDRGGSSGSVMPSLDAIAEFRNMTSNYSAEYGLSSAATITTVIRSGTKQFHASAWEFDRNDALDARNYFNPAPQKVAELRFNTYGFNLGGQVPVWKSHPTFFFYNMEWRSLVQGGVFNLVVPPTSAYGGNLGSTAITVPTAAQLSPAQQARFTADGLVLGQPFPNNTIPSNLLDPNAVTLLAAGIFPANNATSNGKPTFQGGNNSPTTVREEIGRVDHQFSDKFSVFGHWISEQISQTYGTTQWSNDNSPRVFDVFGNPAYSAVVHTTYVISPTLLNEASFNYNGNRIHITPAGLVAAPSGFTFNRLFTGPNANQRIPEVQLKGSTGTDYSSNWTPWNNKADDYQLRDDVSWTKGAHQIKMGFSWSLYRKAQDAFADTEGQFQFNGFFTGNDFADFLLGYSQRYNEDATKITGQWNNVSYAAYVQDNWRATHRLTLNLGLRWDGVPHTYEAAQQSSNFYPNMYNPANAAVFNANGTINTSATPAAAFGTSPNPILAGIPIYLNGVGIGGKNGIAKGLVDNHWANFGPRLGFAYDLTGAGKTVVRGGFGIMYERVQGNDMYNGANNPPNDVQPILNNVSFSNPGLNVTTGAVTSAATAPVFPASITGIQSNNYKPPVSYQYSAGIQQALGANSVLSLSYVGNQGRHENDYREVNLPPLSALPALLAPGAPAVNTQMGYLGYAGIKMSENEANSHYNSFQTDLHTNLRRDLQLEFAYTYAKAVDSGTSNGSGGDLQNVVNPYIGWRYDIGPSVFDKRNVAFVNFVYQIPLLKNSTNRLMKSTLGGWELSGIVTMESGSPLNIGLNGQNASSIVPNSGNRPNLTGSIRYPKTVAQWFDPTSFSAPALGTYGNLPHNAVYGPGRDNWNLALFKTFVLSESRGSNLQFRAECFNPWNHTQFKGDYNNGGISVNFGANNFGAITGAFDPREFQLGAKLIF